MPNYEQHELAKFVPPMGEQDLESLKADIQAKGQLMPILTYQGKIIDGWSRYGICKELGIEPKIVEWKPEAGQSVVGAVVSWNIPRRHLSSAQKAALALLIEPELAREAKDRQRAAGGAGPRLRSEKKKKAQETPESEEPEIVKPKKDRAAGTAAEQAARIAGTNRQYVADVKRIRQYSERLFNQVVAGELAITDAKKEMRKAQKRVELRKAARKVVKESGRPSYKIEVADAIDAMKHMDKGSVRLAITMPPLAGQNPGPRTDKEMQKHWAHAERWIEECFRCLTPDGSLWIICDASVEHHYRVLAEKIGMSTRLMPWYFVYGRLRGSDFNESYMAVARCRVNPKHFVFNPSPFTLETGKLWNDVWGVEKEIRLLTDNASERLPDFPQQLPLDLVRPIVEAHSEPGDTVLEPFAGAATAGVACLELGGRKYLGIEPSPRLAQQALDRLRSVKAAKQPKELA